MTADDLLALAAVLAAWLGRELTPMVLAHVKAERKARRDAEKLANGGESHG